MSTKNNSLSALAWLVETGADEAIGEAPVNRFAKTLASPLVGREAEGRSSGPFEAPSGARRSPKDETGAARGPALFSELPVVSSSQVARNLSHKGGAESDSIGNAQSLAGAAETLTELKAALEGFDGCALKRSAEHTVFADGNPASRIMLIGEAPGREEDRLGLPFVGRAGKLLDKMLASINLDRSTAYITNVLNWRPPDNRDPSPEEAAMCLPFLRRHIELVNPGIIILLGAVAARHVMGFSEGIMKLRGRWLEYRVGDVMVPVLPTLHPAYLLRQPAHKKLAWRDLQAAEQKIISLGLLETKAAVR
jgi:uracil-DNA glycosylase